MKEFIKILVDMYDYAAEDYADAGRSVYNKNMDGWDYKSLE